MTRAVIFDMDGVLCELSDRDRISFLVDLTGNPPKVLADSIWGSGFESDSDIGTYSADEYLKEFGRRVGYPMTRELWVEYRSSGMTPKSDIIGIAQAVTAHAKVALLTNNGHLLKEAIDDLFPELRPIFGESIFVSAEFRCAKPSPQIYHDLCRKLGVLPEEAIMIDDRLENIEGARDAGLGGIHFLDAASLTSALLDFKVLSR